MTKKQTIHPISWHEECLKNSKEFTDRIRENIKRLQADLTRNEAENEFSERQIMEAKKRGLKEFDREKFLIPKKNNQNK